jgi:hypothetical protein
VEEQVFWRQLFSVRQLLSANDSDQPFNMQSWPNRLRNHYPLLYELRGGTIFHRWGREGCKKSAGIELLVDNMYGDKTLSIIQTNCFIKAFKGIKLTKMTKRTANIVLAITTVVYKAWWQNHQHSSHHKVSCYIQPIFKPKRSRLLCAQDGFFNGRGLLMEAKASRQSASLLIAKYCHSGFVSNSER